MDQIPAGYLRALTDAINSLTGDAQRVVMAKVSEMLASGDYATPLDLVGDLLEELEPLIAATAQNAASLSAQSYDLMRMAAVGEPMGAVPYSGHVPEATTKAFYGMAHKHEEISPFVTDVLNRLDYEAKRASGATMFSNGAHDSKRPKFARVPTGPETCPFCIMLASRGFVYAGEESAGKLNHYHPNCDCRVVPQWGSESIEGYDPDVYYDQYRQMLESGELDAERLGESARRAHKRSAGIARAQREAAEQQRLRDIRALIDEGRSVSFRAKSPTGGDAIYQVNTPALTNLRSSMSELGYDTSNVEQLASEIVKRSAGHSFERDGRGYYSQNVRMEGANGEMGRVKLVWSMRDGRMTLVDVDFLKKGSRR